jgi:hypothetical protein
VPTGPEGRVEAIGRIFTGAGLPFPLMGSRLGASVPSFAVAFLLTLLVLPRRGRPAPHSPSQAPPGQSSLP